MLFLNREFKSDSGVLIPRPTGEAMIQLLKYITEEVNSIADVGCGAGHLGITAALEFPYADIILIDNSREAINNTTDNANLYDVVKRCAIYEEDIRDSNHLQVDVILTNLNFVPNDREVLTEEPASAIFGGPTGMELYESFWNKIKEDGMIPKYIITLCLKDQFSRMDSLAVQSGYQFSRRLVYATMYKKV